MNKITVAISTVIIIRMLQLIIIKTLIMTIIWYEVNFQFLKF
jgi:hypothetical protein